MESALSLPELEAILSAARDKEKREQKFMAALKGIDLDKGSQADAKERLEDVKRRVAARKAGKSEQELYLSEVGIDVVYD